MTGIGPLSALASSDKGTPEERLTFLSVPNHPRGLDVPSDKAHISWQCPQTQELLTTLARDEEVDKRRLTADKPVPAPTISVQGLNGTGTPRQAAEAAGQFRAAGFTVDGTGNAPRNVPSTMVTYPSGLEVRAAAMAARLKTTVTPQKRSAATPGAVALTRGPDFAGVRG
ncbi:LytR C-terminal domain-containing protein [Streptomyces hydrogenans]|uniref:LytR C-terminal domain-containing protein n=1 Tax=Streptomyces hydrogenans TaxID=1873719 RepID=UPI00382E2417